MFREQTGYLCSSPEPGLLIRLMLQEMNVTGLVQGRGAGYCAGLVAVPAVVRRRASVCVLKAESTAV